MEYKLKSKNGKTKCLLKAGKDFVTTVMETSEVEKIIKTGTLTQSAKADYQICVNKVWYFEGEIVKEEAPTSPKQAKKNED